MKVHDVGRYAWAKSEEAGHQARGMRDPVQLLDLRDARDGHEVDGSIGAEIHGASYSERPIATVGDRDERKPASPPAVADQVPDEARCPSGDVTFGIVLVDHRVVNRLRGHEQCGQVRLAALRGAGACVAISAVPAGVPRGKAAARSRPRRSGR